MTNTKLKEFGLYITNLRIKKGFESQRKLSLVSGVSTTTISRIESGKQRAEPKTLEKLAFHLGISFEELMQKVGYLPEGKKENVYESKPQEIEKIFESQVLYKGKPLTEAEKKNVKEFIDLALKTIRIKEEDKS